MKLGIATFVKLFSRYLIALVLNLLKDIFERSGISFNKFRTSAGNRVRLCGSCYRYFFVFACLGIFSSTHPFSYDSAIYAAQKGDIKGADEQLKKIVVDAPDSADVLYDAGFIAHGLNNFSQAVGYFTRAAECAHDDKELCFRAHFNAGNACVDNKNLHCALEQYDKALVLDPDNEYARHNRDRVAQMLQEQEKQQDQQKDKDQKEDQKDNQDKQNEDQQKQDEQSGDGNDQEQNDGKNDQQQGNDQHKQNQKNNISDGQSDQKSKGEQGDDSEQGDNDAQREKQGDADNKQQKSTKNKERNGEQDFNKKPNTAQKDRDKQQGKEHGQSTDKQDGTKDKTNATSGDRQGQDTSSSASANASSEALAKEDALIDDPWLVSILNNQELRDKAVNKQLMEAKVRQHGGKNGQNCW